MFCSWWNASFAIFMDSCFKSFRLNTHLGVKNIPATVVLNKSRLRKCTIIGDKQLQKKWTWPLWTAHIKQKRHCNFDCCWLKLQKGGLFSFFWILRTQHSEHGFYRQNGPECGPIARIVIAMKNGGGSRLFEW